MLHKTRNCYSRIILQARYSEKLYIAAGGLDKKLYLFSRTDNTPLWSYTTDGYVYVTSISADGSYIAAGSDDNKVYFFSRLDNTPLWSYQTGAAAGAVVSADGNYVVAGSGDNKIYLFSRVGSVPLWRYTTGGGVGATISADGSYIAAGGYDGKVYLFGPAEKEEQAAQWLILAGVIVVIVLAGLVCWLKRR